MDNKEKSPEQELIESIGLMIEKGMESNTNIYTGVVKSVDGKRAVVTVNGQNQNVSIATADVSSGNVVRVFVPEGNMSAAFIIKAEASGGGGTTTTAYGDLTGKPQINGVTLVGNKTSKELNLYGTGNAPPYPVTSVNGQTGDVTIEVGGNVDSVNGKTGAVVLTANDVGALPNTTVIPDKTSQLDNDSGYITNSALTGYAKKTEIPTKTSELTNDSGYITNVALEPYAKTVDIPTKTSQLNNDSGYITANDVPVKSVNTKTGAVVLTQDDVGDGTTYVRTHNDFTNVLKTQINTNKDNIATLDGDVEGLQTDVGTLKTNVGSLQTALTSKQDVIIGAASTITENNLVTNRALVSNSSGKVAVSNVTSTELGYLDGVTSNVQTQLNKKLEKAPVTSVNNKTGAVQLNASDVGALPNTTVIPSKTSQLDNDSGFITDIPIASATQLGGVKVGAGLSVTENGVLSATGGGTADAVEWNNVLDKPTTIAGYGITDAKIENGTITLGNKTITPLTSAPVTSVNGAIGEVKSTFYVTVTQGDNNTATADKTAEEVYAAYVAGYAVYAIVISKSDDVAPLMLPMMVGLKFHDLVILSFIALTGFEYTAAAYNGSAWVVITGMLASREDIPTIPEYLPNPNALNIKIGNTTTSYDGSLTQNVEIPEGVPSVTTADNGKFLRVVNGVWTAVAIADASGVKFYWLNI